MSRITIKDIAEMLQISTSTVSRSLSNHPDISDKVKERVREVAALMNYYPSEWGKNFRNKKSKLIGVIIPKMDIFFIPSIINGISNILTEKDYHFIILISDNNLETETKNIEFCCNYCVDGILVSLTSQTQDLSHFNRAKQLEIPIVIFDKSIPQKEFDEVLIDDEATAELIAGFLLNKNAKNLLCVFGSKDLNITKKREHGIFKILMGNDITIEKIYAQNESEACDLISEILPHHKFDSIFAMSDEILAGLFSAFIKLNISPEEYLITAFSSAKLPPILSRNISIVKHDGYEIGETAALKILEKVQNKSTDVETKYIQVGFYEALV